MENFNVSIIIPAYNAENTIKNTINSLLSQSLSNIEIIIIDDGSTDNTAKIIKEFMDENPIKIKYFYQKNSGVSAARNLGIKNASGTYIGFVDADDTVDKYMYEKLYDKAFHNDADIVVCGRIDIDAEGKKIVKLPKLKDDNSNIYKSPSIISDMTAFIWDKIYKTSMIKGKRLEFSKEIKYAEDFLFLFESLLETQKVSVVDEPLYYYYVRGTGAATSNFNNNILDIPKAIEKVITIAYERGLIVDIERYIWYVFVGYYIRRYQDFYKYDDKNLQKDIFYAFYNLFEKYFYNWKETFVKRKKANILVRCYRKVFVSPYLMSIFINAPSIVKKGYIMLPILVSKMINRLKSKIRKIRNRKNSILYSYAIKKPIEANKVLFASYFGANISDNIFYMVKDLLKQNSNLQIYVVSNNIKRDRRFIEFNKMNVKLVKLYSKEYIELLATAKFLICNSRFPSFFSKRVGQVYLNTWHGTPLKTLGKRMKKGIKDLGNNQSNFLMCDYLLYPNEYTKKHMMEDFFLNELYTGKVITCGYPRNSVFFDEENTSKIKNKLNINDKKLFAYMPTWRGNTLNTSDVKKYELEVKKILEEIDLNLNDDVILFVKLHQVVMNKIKLSNYKHIRPFHPLYDTYEFLNIMDCLITDYSSVFFDFSNKNKKIILFTYDFDEYNKDRGTYLDISDLPFPRINNVNELADFMNKSAKKDDFVEYYESVIREFCQYDNINTPQILNNIVFNNSNKSDRIEIEDFSDRKIKEVICFMSNLNREEEVNNFYNLLNEHPEYLYVFAQWSFNDITNDILAELIEKNSKFKFIITQSEMPVTLGEIIKILFYRKTKFLKNDVRKIYKAELQRILPFVDIENVMNFSNDKKFTDIYNLFK